MTQTTSELLAWLDAEIKHAKDFTLHGREAKFAAIRRLLSAQPEVEALAKAAEKVDADNSTEHVQIVLGKAVTSRGFEYLELHRSLAAYRAKVKE